MSAFHPQRTFRFLPIADIADHCDALPMQTNAHWRTPMNIVFRMALSAALLSICGCKATTQTL